MPFLPPNQQCQSTEGNGDIIRPRISIQIVVKFHIKSIPSLILFINKIKYIVTVKKYFMKRISTLIDVMPYQLINTCK